MMGWSEVRGCFLGRFLPFGLGGGGVVKLWWQQWWCVVIRCCWFRWGLFEGVWQWWWWWWLAEVVFG
jgi:hypothetical protein